MILSRAPFRISLGGGGTDLPSYYERYGGFIMAAAVNKYINIAINRPAADEFIRLKYSRVEQVRVPSELEHDLVRPALTQLQLGGSLEIVSMADVPAGTGLGSSATYLVALLAALYDLKRERVPARVIAETAADIEMNQAKHPVGKQDHYMAAFGGITCLEIDTNGQVRVTPAAISLTTIEELKNSIVLFYTGLTRTSHDILLKQQTQTQGNVTTVVDSLHRTKELGYEIRDMLEQGDVERFGRLLDVHWQSKKKRDTSITTPAIDEWYATAMADGAYGGKLIGAGGGGFLMFCCPRGAKERVRRTLAGSGLREMRYDFDFEGCKVMVNV